MKRFLTILLCAAMLVSSFAFTAFAEDTPLSADAQAVVELLNALNESSTAEQIATARNAFIALSYDDQDAIGISDAAKDVIDKIAELEASTKPDVVASVGAAYNKLSARDKATVYNFSTLIGYEKSVVVTEINKLIQEIGDPMCADIYGSRNIVESAFAKYDILSDEAKVTVVGYETLLAAKANIDRLLAFDENKKVDILNSTMKGLAKYDRKALEEAYAIPLEGIYYYFEEVDQIERGESTNGYYHPDNNLEQVQNQKYAKLEMDIKITDIDVMNGWPAPFRLTVGNNLGASGSGESWSGYDFVNGVFFQGASAQDHQKIFRFDDYTKYDLTLNIWHHFTVVYDNNTLTYTVDGEEVFKTTIEASYDWIIFYPWLCNLEMTNVHFIDRNGKDTLSPFRTAYNSKLWEKSENEEGATMLHLIEDALADTRKSYESLSAEDKAKVVDAAQIERVQAIIDELRTHSVTVEDGTASDARAKGGSKITITANAAAEGTEFDKWEVVSGDVEITNPRASTTTFVMGESDVTIKATFKDKNAGGDNGDKDNKGGDNTDAKAGDVNGDDALNAKDVTSIMKFLIGKTPKDFNETAADFNGDGKTNAKDVTGLMKFLVKGA